MRTLLVGHSGRMGKKIQALASEFTDVSIVGGVSRTKCSDEDYTRMSDVAVEADMVIDFSLPDFLPSVCAWCLEKKVPLVSGVTGLSEENINELKTLAEEVPVLWSPNMSLGIAWVNKVVGQMGKLSGFDFQIEETHHSKKKDRPSGTAVMLQETLKKSVEDEDLKVPEPLSIRGGGVFGIHKVMAMSEGETITMEHVALNRGVFARGALHAAEWLKFRPAGFYSLEDVLDHE